MAKCLGRLATLRPFSSLAAAAQARPVSVRGFGRQVADGR